MSSQKKGKVGRKAADGFLSQIPTVPLNRRSSIRSLAAALGVSRTTLHRTFQLKKVRRHSNRVKPPLKEKNKRERVRFCMSMLDQTTSTPESSVHRGVFFRHGAYSSSR